MQQNKTSTYIKYAIGEIILVVFGILIALSINNWNEKRIQQKTIESIYALVKNDLIQDINEFEYVVGEMKSKAHIFQKVMNQELTKQDYLDHPEYTGIILGFADIRIENRGYKLLEEKADLFNIQNDSLYLKVQNLYGYFEVEIGVSQRETADDFQDNWKYWKNNQPWFASLQREEVNEDIIEYMLNSWDYRNRVTAFWILHHQIYQGQLEGFSQYAKTLVDLIDERYPPEASSQ